MVQDANRSLVADRHDPLEHILLMRSLADRENLRVRVIIHAVQVQTMEIREHQTQDRIKPVHMLMAMVKIVDNPHVVRFFMLSKPLANRDHVFGFAMPPSMIVECQLTSHLAGAIH